jgi:hypothetical protein
VSLIKDQIENEVEKFNKQQERVSIIKVTKLSNDEETNFESKTNSPLIHGRKGKSFGSRAVSITTSH